MAKILVVEDEEELREIFVEHLVDEGHCPVGAGNGKEALKIYPSAKPDLIISDINMPHMDGYQFLQELQSKYPEVEDIPFFFLSGLDSVDNQIKGLNFGIDEYLCKPVDLSLLTARIASSLLRQQKIQDKIASIAAANDVASVASDSSDHADDSQSDVGGLLASRRLRLSKRQQENIKSITVPKNFHSASLINSIGRRVGMSRLFLKKDKYEQMIEDIKSSEFDESFFSVLSRLFSQSVVHFLKRGHFSKERAIIVPYLFECIENENIRQNYIDLIDALQKTYAVSVLSEIVNIPGVFSAHAEVMKPLSLRKHVQIIEAARLRQIEDLDFKSLRIGAVSMNYAAVKELGEAELAKLRRLLKSSNVSFYVKEIPEGKISYAQMMKADLLSVSK